MRVSFNGTAATSQASYEGSIPFIAPHHRFIRPHTPSKPAYLMATVGFLLSHVMSNPGSLKDVVNSKVIFPELALSFGDEAGCLEAMVSDMRLIIRVSQGRRDQPSAVIVGGRTLQSSCESGPRVGYDRYKRRSMRCASGCSRLQEIRSNCPKSRKALCCCPGAGLSSAVLPC